MDADYFDRMVSEGWVETKSIYGVILTQPCNNFMFNPKEYELSDNDYDAIISYVILKYSQSNNISIFGI